eukprot:CAMPEP_0185775142 /NCGR_PEP_ID=MMETSP1174-20130828/81186_1 /TAXON_ID=35687 /ORGANISM="Dictyocha speculum, Strain CCMP1381" /LENGTH=251 /DNA_ID=CAMNT_0028462615 /DNA_START=21 /DNA_END=778 /DNA_ORIENTATION=-
MGNQSQKQRPASNEATSVVHVTADQVVAVPLAENNNHVPESAGEAAAEVQEVIPKQDIPAGAAETGTGDEETLCAVCLIEPDLVLMPCCGNVGSTTRFCLRCIELVCEHSGGIGRCPKCRATICVEKGEVKINAKKSQCRMCRQQHIIVNNGMCDACNLGSQKPLSSSARAAEERRAFPIRCTGTNKHQRRTEEHRGHAIGGAALTQSGGSRKKTFQKYLKRHARHLERGRSAAGTDPTVASQRVPGMMPE